MSNRMKHISRIAACACAVCALCMLLVSCSGGDAEKKTPAQLNREYMASVNSISTEASDALESFGTAATEGDIAAMRQSASEAAKKLEKISELQVSEGLSQVHEEYKAGAEELSTALSDYVEAYAALQNSQNPDASALETQLKEIQARYDSGIEHLSKADALVAEYAGDGSSSQEDGAKSAQGDASADAADAS